MLVEENFKCLPTLHVVGVHLASEIVELSLAKFQWPWLFFIQTRQM